MVANKSVSLVLLVVLLSLHILSAQKLCIRVDGGTGEDDAACLNFNSSQQHMCKSLEFIVESLTKTTYSSVEIEIWSSQLSLTSALEFVDILDLTITGASLDMETVIQCNGSDAGLSFVQVQYLTIEALAIEHCAVLLNSTNINPSRPEVTGLLHSALYILNCTHVSILNVAIRWSKGMGLSMYDTNGRVSIEGSTFLENCVEPSSEGGGGLHIEFTKCSPGLVACSNHGGRNKHSVYTIYNCTFLDNCARSTSSSGKYASPSSKGIIPTVGKGGGLFLAISSDASNNTIIISDCLLVNNSATKTGGGASILLYNSVRNNSIFVTHTKFRNNSSTGKYAGGGVSLGFMLYKLSEVNSVTPEYNTFLCNECIFHQNSAYRLGGGTGIFVTKNVGYRTTNNILFVNSTWTKNSAHFGAAVYISPGIWDYSEYGLLPKPVFTNCIFVSNIVHHTSDSLHNGVRFGFGTVFITEVRVVFNRSITFYNNNGSAVHLSGSVLQFSDYSDVIFNGNVGQNGGAIAMYTSSALFIGYNSTLNFTNNTATSDGGAIYSNTFLPHLFYRNCFIQPTSPEQLFTNSHFFFSGNKAKGKKGHSIYASSLKPCKIFCNDSTRCDPRDILSCVSIFSFENIPSNIVTSPYKFSLNESSSLDIVPGYDHTIQMNVFDEANNSLLGIVYEVSIISDNSVKIDPAFTQVSNNTVNIQGHVGDIATLVLGTSFVSLYKNITLIQCPPGYIQKENTTVCKCAATEYYGIVTCDPKVLLVHGFWMGPCDTSNSTKLCTAHCPYGFCSYNTDHEGVSYHFHALPTDTTKLDSEVCGSKRTGRLCSKCADNHSVYFHSWRYTCGREKFCGLGWLFYLLSEIFPLTLCFVGILVFNISFTTGNINGFIFSAQILDALATNANGLIEFPEYIRIIHMIQNLCYRFFNLDFFSLERLSFCLWKGATVMDALIMKYVTVGYALVLVLLTIFISRGRCGRFYYCTKFYNPKTILIHGLSAFFILCYSQCARVSFQILDSTCLFSTNFTCEVTVVHRGGYMDYLGNNHLKYAVIAIVVLVCIVIIPPLLLLLYPLMFKVLGLCKLSEFKLASILWRVMPIQLLDSFQSSFKDQFRFFAGLYFLYRAFALAAYAYSRTMLQFYTIVEIQLIVALALHGVFQPYKEKRYNITDSLLFANLAVINGITLYNVAEEKYGNGQSTSFKFVEVASIIQTVLIFLPLIYLIILAIEKIMTRMKKCKRDKTAAKGNLTDNSLPSLRDSTEELHYMKL